ncbi:MAG: hypothetical protein P9L94_05415 [Candidatus Hinthialibacter antarcticus]|nr:hypothetical protein [Candidatus Hinthialibacter antarcticus]
MLIQGTMFTILLLGAVIGLGVASGYLLGKRRKRPLPPESGSGWTNNAIRRQGESGKGIR